MSGPADTGAPVTLLRTPLHADHVRLKARLVDFGGWDMPVQYAGLVEEHKTVRTAVGLFDVSHMGEINVEGRGSTAFLQAMTTNDVAKLTLGQAQYSALLYPNGTVVDDIIVYRRGHDSYFICVNASNASKDYAWLKEHAPAQGVVLQDQSADYGQIAIQGPRARELVQSVVDIRMGDMKYYHFAEGKVLGVPALIARTGYTGELGYELYLPATATSKAWNALLETGASYGVKPCGLGARDTLRLEMGYLLYGNDMDDTTSALECGLGWITKFDKGDFIGRDALLAQKEAGLKRKLVGFEMVDRAIGRHGYPVFTSPEGGDQAGVVTSGSPSPSLGRNVGMAYVPASHATLGTEIWVSVRGERRKARVTKKPFYAEGTAAH
jgi:aminomethyltransferase